MQKFALDKVRARLLQDTDRCVKCALCLPTCPTYVQTRDEGESPRGRVALIQALAGGKLSGDDAAPHVNNCLACRACEKVCPATVPFGAILDHGRALIATQRPYRAERALARLLASPRILRWLSAAHRLALRLPLVGRRSRWLALPGRRARHAAPVDGERATTRGEIAILRGCISAAFDADAAASLAALFTTCGHPVRWIDGCCGAVSAHSGDLDTAGRRARAIGAQVASVAPRAVVHPASGCAAAVKDFAALTQDPGARDAAARIADPFALLLEAGLEARLRALAPPARHIALHLPCTQRNVLGGDAVTAALRAVPGLRVSKLAGHGCCGAAGTHMLTHRQSAARFGRGVLADLGDTAVDAVLSTNVGCAWHLRGLLHDDNRPLPVRHPAQFIADLLAEGRVGAVAN